VKSVPKASGLIAQAGRHPDWQPVEPPRRPVLLVNARSGDGRRASAALVEGAQERGVAVRLVRDGERLADLAVDAVAGGADALGVAGGDGSLAAVAAVARLYDVPFVCVPAGTRNHFALDLGVDRRDPLGALDAFTDGLERRIDAASVDGRLFLNNVSLGIYGEAVHQPAYRDAKARTLLETTRRALGPSAAAAGLRLVDDRGHEHRDPAVVLVSNNPYALDRPAAQGTRPTLDGGRLGVVVLERPGTVSAPGRAWSAASLEVDAPSTVHAGIDGEAVELSPPLAFTILPGELRVRIAAHHPGVSPSGLLPRGA
jgi:diacylglycerol kinase family enzyme